MTEITKQLIEEIHCLEQQKPANRRLKTGDIRVLSKKRFRALPNKDITFVLTVCEQLLETRKWALGIIAYDWAYQVRKQYTIDVYDIFYRWLKHYVRDWSDCDDFCTHAFGALVIQYPLLFSLIVSWTQDADFWVRRAAAVVLIPAIHTKQYDGMNPFVISDLLLEDEHDLVRKGYGWMLKVLAQVDEERVVAYLIENHARMPRVSFRYAIEKLNRQMKQELMKR